MIVILKFGRLEHQVLLYKTVYRVFLYGKKKIAIQEIFTALEISTFTKPLKVIVKPYI